MSIKLKNIFCILFDIFVCIGIRYTVAIYCNRRSLRITDIKFLRNYINCGQFHRECNFLCEALPGTGGSDFTLENQASRERKHYSCDFRGAR